jgi:hypothetical protein
MKLMRCNSLASTTIAPACFAHTTLSIRDHDRVSIFEYGTSVWSSAGWRERATAWADERLAAAGLARTGAVEQPRVRPWATVLRIPTSSGTVWLKATGPEVAFEVGLYEVLVRVAPARVLTPLATDAERGWLLLPDGGPSLGDRGADIAAALPAYARLQRDLAPDVDELLTLGVADMRPAAMPARFEEALAAIGGDDRIAALRPAVAEWCERLAASPVPASVDHNDLHAYNILAGERFYDWGDAVVAHPFASMLALEWVDTDAAGRERLRDAYLEPFTDLAPRAELVETLALACRVARIARALVWQRAIRASGSEPVNEDWRSAPGEWLRSL